MLVFAVYKFRLAFAGCLTRLVFILTDVQVLYVHVRTSVDSGSLIQII